MGSSARFGVDTKLTALLGDSYSSSEKALRELIDNAWDADASVVRVTLPDTLSEVMSNAEIIITDDGTGMTEQEVRTIYLRIANDRWSRSKDARTTGKKRPVKGRKGIGKFAGLAAAHTMTVETVARGKSTTVVIEKNKLLEAAGGDDLEAIDLPIETSKADPNQHGTTVTLSNLDQSRAVPNADKLRRILVREYARQNDINIFINDEPLQVTDLGGESQSSIFNHPDIGPVTISWTVVDKPLPKGDSGFVYRVGGKVVGRSTFCGIEEEEDIPEKVRNRLWGEIEAEGLDKHVTADWGDIVENSLPLKDVQREVTKQVSRHLREVCKVEVNAARARLQKAVKARIETLPEHRRNYAFEAVERVIQKYFPEGDEKVRVLVNLVLDALERDEYYMICEKIASASGADVATIADCLSEFGLVDLAVMVKQARNRLDVLDEFERLAGDESTKEVEIHKAFENNLWILGPQYCLISSNKTLKKVIDDYLQKGGSRKRASKRPDLFLGQSPDRRKLLIEFKRPTETVGRNAESQVKKYRDDLTPNHGAMDIMVIGGKVNASLRPDPNADAQFKSYMAIIGDARAQLEWLIEEMKSR